MLGLFSSPLAVSNLPTPKDPARGWVYTLFIKTRVWRKMDPLFPSSNGIYLFCGPECGVMVGSFYPLHICMFRPLQHVSCSHLNTLWTTNKLKFKSLEGITQFIFCFRVRLSTAVDQHVPEQTCREMRKRGRGSRSGGGVLYCSKI